MSNRAISLLTLACHPNTPSAEALAALKQLGKVADKNGGLGALFVPTPSSSIPMSYNDTQNKFSDMEQKLVALQLSNERLENEVSRLLLENSDLNEKNTRLREAARDRFGRVREDGSMPYDEFVFRVERILGKVWVDQFHEQTGIGHSELSKMRLSGVATPRAIRYIHKLEPIIEKPNDTKFWSVEEVAIIRKISPTVFTDIELAKKASEEITNTLHERIITESQIKKLRIDSKNTNGVFKFSGYGGKREIKLGQAKNPRGRPPLKKRTTFSWIRYPDVEMMVCNNFLKPESERLSINEIAKQANQQMGTNLTSAYINKRLKSVPPRRMINEIITSGETCWKELWYLGSKLDKKDWHTVLFSELNHHPITIGEDVSGIPIHKLDILREKVRFSMGQRDLIVDIVKRHHPLGISREKLKVERDQYGVITGDRVAELKSTGYLIEKKGLLFSKRLSELS